MTTLKRLTLLLAIVAQLTLGLGRGLVLCVESDGSVRFELASLACCDPGPVHELHQEAEQRTCSHENEGCGDCTDRALQLVQVPKAEPALPALSALPASLVAGWSPRPFAARAGPAAEPRLTCLRTTVLRC